MLTAHFLCDAASAVVTQTGRIVLQIEVILSSKSAGIGENGMDIISYTRPTANNFNFNKFEF
jgi:hypothetical protein